MVSQEPIDDRCGESLESGYCEGWPMDNGFCQAHGGKNYPTNGGAPEANQNAREHGLHSTPEYLLDDLDGHHKDTYYATHEALCTRFERTHGKEPDYLAKKRLSRVAVEIVKEDLADEYLKDNHSSNLLVEDVTIDYDPETGPVEVSQANKLLSVLSDLKRETRMTLKDMGLLEDPDSSVAESVESLAVVLSEDS